MAQRSSANPYTVISLLKVVRNASMSSASVSFVRTSLSLTSPCPSTVLPSPLGTPVVREVSTRLRIMSICSFIRVACCRTSSSRRSFSAANSSSRLRVSSSRALRHVSGDPPVVGVKDPTRPRLPAARRPREDYSSSLPQASFVGR